MRAHLPNDCHSVVDIPRARPRVTDAKAERFLEMHPFRYWTDSAVVGDRSLVTAVCKGETVATEGESPLVHRLGVNRADIPLGDATFCAHRRRELVAWHAKRSAVVADRVDHKSHDGYRVRLREA